MKNAPEISNSNHADIPTDDVVLSDKRVADVLGVSLVTVWRLRTVLPPKIQISPGRNGRLRSEVLRFLASRRGK